jgi:hypothetical protein
MSTGVFMTGVVVLHESCYEGLMIYARSNKVLEWDDDPPASSAEPAPEKPETES